MPELLRGDPTLVALRGDMDSLLVEGVENKHDCLFEIDNDPNLFISICNYKFQEDLPELELKVLPNHLFYYFYEGKKLFVIIVAFDWGTIDALKMYKIVFAYKLSKDVFNRNVTSGWDAVFSS